MVSSHNSSPAPPRETWAERGGLAVMHNAAAAGEAVQSHRREKRPPGKRSVLLPTPHAQNVPRDGRSPPPLAPRAFFMLPQRSNGEPCPPSGRLRGFRGMEMARHLTSLLERSSWPVVSRSAEACLASGVPGSSVSTSAPPPPFPSHPCPRCSGL